MKIFKRNGQSVNFDIKKITLRLDKLIKGEINNIKLDDLTGIDSTEITIKICNKIIDNMTTHELDVITAEYCSFMSSINYKYGLLADRLIISDHHKNTKKYENFSVITEEFYKKDLRCKDRLLKKPVLRFVAQKALNKGRAS